MAIIYSELDTRRFFKWGDFLLENQDFKFDRDEVSYIKKLTEKGNICQSNLEKKLNDFKSYEDFIKTMLLNIAIQDDIIKDIIEYQKYIMEYRTKSKDKKIKKGFRWGKI